MGFRAVVSIRIISTIYEMNKAINQKINQPKKISFDKNRVLKIT